ncbi:MAG: methanogenesis marker 2 protein [Promethearchaeota archaeon]
MDSRAPPSLADVAAALRSHGPILRKLHLPAVISEVAGGNFAAPWVVSDFGEDSALLDVGLEDYLLALATDSIDQNLANNDPWVAGYAGVLACAEDVYACGGTPLAACASVAYKDEVSRKGLLRGLTDGSVKFQVPLVRGHTHELAEGNSVHVTIVGRAPRQGHVSAGGAGVGDKLGLIFDPNGRPAKVNPLYWDTTTYETPERVRFKHEVVAEAGKAGLVTACKDVSNAGIVGTALQMAEFSGVGLTLDLDRLNVPVAAAKVASPAKFPAASLVERRALENPLVRWLLSYVTTGFLVALPAGCAGELRELASKRGLQLDLFGECVPPKKIFIRLGNEQVVLFDYSERALTFPRHALDQRSKESSAQ